MLKIILKKIFFFDGERYWRRREKVFTTKNRLVKWYLVFWLKRQNQKQAADIGINADGENNFLSKPILNPHGIKGIVISANAVIGRNCWISHHVTIGRSWNGVPKIGDDCFIGPGATIFGDITIGNNVRIGANCPVFFDVPDNATVVMQKPKVIVKDADYRYYTLKTDFEQEKTK